MGKTLRRRVYLVEGETEESLLEDLKKSKHMMPGKIHKINCWLSNPLAILRRLPAERVEVVVIFDTDRIATLDNFCEVLRLLDKQYYLYLAQQTPNLEGELVYSCTKLKCPQDLFKAFNCNNEDEFKHLFLRTSNRKHNLDKLGFDVKKLWTRPLHQQIQKSLGKLVPKKVYSHC